MPLPWNSETSTRASQFQRIQHNFLSVVKVVSSITDNPNMLMFYTI